MNRDHFRKLLDLAADYLDINGITAPPYAVSLTDYDGPRDRVAMQWVTDPGIPGADAATVNPQNDRLRTRTVAYGDIDLALTWGV